ncbi:hypothetical protein LXL04_031587 [Taraxacum kok-saghyz]
MKARMADRRSGSSRYSWKSIQEGFNRGFRSQALVMAVAANRRLVAMENNDRAGKGAVMVRRLVVVRIGDNRAAVGDRRLEDRSRHREAGRRFWERAGLIDPVEAEVGLICKKGSGLSSGSSSGSARPKSHNWVLQGEIEGIEYAVFHTIDQTKIPSLLPRLRVFLCAKRKPQLKFFFFHLLLLPPRRKPQIGIASSSSSSAIKDGNHSSLSFAFFFFASSDKCLSLSFALCSLSQFAIPVISSCPKPAKLTSIDPPQPHSSAALIQDTSSFAVELLPFCRVVVFFTSGFNYSTSFGSQTCNRIQLQRNSITTRLVNKFRNTSRPISPFLHLPPYLPPLFVFYYSQPADSLIQICSQSFFTRSNPDAQKFPHQPMEIDDDYESFSFPNNEPSPSPKRRRLKRLKKSIDVAGKAAPVERVSELLDLPRVDFAKLEALESSDIRAFDDSSEPLPSPTAEGFVGDGDGNELSSGSDDTPVNADRKETKRSLAFDEEFDDDAMKEKRLSSCYDDTRKYDDRKEANRDLEFDECFGDDVMEKELSSDVGDIPVITARKETKRALEFDDEFNESGVDKMVGKETGTANMNVNEDGKKEAVEVAMDEKKEKKKRLKSSSEDPKVKDSSSNKRREAKERRAQLEQLHAESQRLLRETRGASFKPVPVVQKPISSILEKIRQRKLEVSKKFSQLNNDDFVKEDDSSLKHVTNDSKNVETEVGDISGSMKEDEVSSSPKEEAGSDDVGTDGPDICEEQKSHVNNSPKMALDEESTPVLRAPVNDTEELFGDSQTSDSTDSKNEEPDENTISSQEEEMEPSLLTMKLKFDSVPDDISDSEENDKENVAPFVKDDSSPKGAPAKAFLDDEAEEEDDSDNDKMRFGDDDDEDDDNDDDDDDMEDLREMIATGYKEKPIDKETRDELHQKWLEEKDAAGTDDLLRRLNVASKLTEGSLLDHDDEGEDDVQVNDHDDVDDDDDDVEKRPRIPRLDSKKAKEMIAQMFLEKDEGYISSDDEETEKILAKERLLNKLEEKGKLVSPDVDEDSREVFGLIKKLNTVPDARKKAKITSFFDTMLTGGNSNSSSKSSFLSRASNLSAPISSKQGSSVSRSYIFGRDDSNSRSSISISEDTSDSTTKEIQTKKVTTKYSVRSSTTKSSSSSNSSTSLFDILKQSSVKTGVGNKESSVVELSQSVFAAFKIPKKPVKIQGRV